MRSAAFVNACLSILLASLAAGCVGGGKSDVNHPPIANFTITPGAAGAYTFDATKSTDADGDPLTYFWNYTTGTSTQAKFDVTFPSSLNNATLVVVLVVTDAKGLFSSSYDKDTIKLGNGLNQLPKPDLLDTVRWVKPDASVTLDASKSSDPDGDPLNYEWIWGPLGEYDPLRKGPADPFKETSDNPLTFNTALVDPHGQYSFVFDKPGTYNFVCHPHPWMRGRIQVSDNYTASGNAFVDMKGYAFVNQTTQVKPGTNVTFRNMDLDQHTASLTDYIAGTTSGGNSPQLTVTLAQGDYVARLIITDGKGARSTATWGLKASSDAADPKVSLTFGASQGADAQNDIVAAGKSIRRGQFPTPYPLHLESATILWADPTATAVKGSFSLIQRINVNVPANLTEAVQHACTAKPVSAAPYAGISLGPCRVNFTAAGDNNEFEIGADPTSGPVANWTITVQGFQYVRPPFGDFNQFTCHVHMMNGALMVHCF